VKLSIWKYVKVSGRWRYCKPATTPNNKIKPHMVLVAGQEEKHPEGNYYVLDSGQWIKAGPNPADATALAKRRTLMREGVKMGIIEAPVKPQTKTDLNELIDDYLKEISATKKKKTYQAYKVALGYFQQSLATRGRTLPLTREDMISFKVGLRDYALLIAHSRVGTLGTKINPAFPQFHSQIFRFPAENCVDMAEATV
jgi:hypothetical protein